MPNPNYLAGRRLEYDSIKRWKYRGYIATRSAGSHGIWDVCAVKPGASVELIQCKVVDDETTAKRLIKDFRENPPLTPDFHYHLVLEVKVKGKKDLLTTTI